MGDNAQSAQNTPEPASAHQLKLLGERLNRHAEQITRLTNELVALQHVPGPYQELASEVKRLGDSLDIQRRIVASLEGFADRATVPTITVRHWLEADGTWGYETTVTITPATLNALTETLAYTDAAARHEARRRADEDARAKQQSSSNGRGY